MLLEQCERRGVQINSLAYKLTKI